MKLTNKKIVGGVIALLAIVSLAQTQAILQIAKASNANRTAALTQVSSEDQTAQVTLSSNCLQVTPVPNIEKSLYTSESQVSYKFFVNLKIKNLCPTQIAIIDPRTINPDFLTYDQLLYSKIQRMYLNGVYTISDVDSNPLNNSGIADVTLEIIAPAELSFNSPVGLAVGNTLGADTISPNQTRYFTLLVEMDSNDATIPLRVVPQKLKWFKTSSYGDSIISAREILTTNLPTSVVFSKDFIMGSPI